MRKLLLSAVAATALVGCSVTTIDYKTMTAAQLAQQPEYMPTVRSPPANATYIGPVQAVLCQRSPREPMANAYRALVELKRQAAMRGGRALVDLQTKEGFARAEECMSSASASAVAYDFPLGQESH